MMEGIIAHKTSKYSIAMIAMVALLFCCTTGYVDSLGFEACDTQISNFEAAVNSYNADQSNRTKCIAAKEAGATLLDCEGLSESQKKDYKATLDGIFCN
jgi:hypothetical protein